MNLHKLLQERAALGRFIRVGMIGAGKFGTMYLAQSRNLAGIHIAAIADLNPERAHNATSIAGWDPVQSTASSLTDAITTGKTFITDDAEALIAEPNIDIVIDATGDPRAGIRHVHTSCREQKDIVMVNVEADALAGPQLAREADEAGIIYSLAYGDQPALICELVDWARTSGFEVIAAGKGTKYLPGYHQSTPETVWEKYGISASEAKSSGMNPRMFNSFIDGTKSAIEMAAVANAAQLKPPPNGLLFPPCSVNDLANTLRPKSSGGQLFQSGQVEVVSSLDRYGQPITEDLRWGVFVVFRDSGDYASRCFAEYGLPTDESGEFAALYRPYHLVGLELGISIGPEFGIPIGQEFGISSKYNYLVITKSFVL